MAFPPVFTSCLLARLVTLVVSDSLRPQGLQPARLLCPWDSPGKSPGVVAMPSSGDLPGPGVEPASLSLLHGQAGSLPPGKPSPLTHSLIRILVSGFNAHPDNSELDLISRSLT